MAKKCSLCGGKIKNGICCDCGMRYYDENDIGNVSGAEEYTGTYYEKAGENQSLGKNKSTSRKNARLISGVISCLAAAAFFIIKTLPGIIDKLDDPKRSPDGTPHITIQDINIPDIPKVSIPKMPKVEIPSGIDDDLKAAIDHDIITLSKQRGIWQEGTYKTGEDIPLGTYLLMPDTAQQFSAGFYPDKEKEPGENMAKETLFEGSRYITVGQEGYLDIQGCRLYDTEKNDVLNDPHDHSGMFLAGRDIEPGTYELLEDPSVVTESDGYYPKAGYKIYLDADIKDPVLKEQGEFQEGMTVTVSKGEFLELDKCVIS